VKSLNGQQTQNLTKKQSISTGQNSIIISLDAKIKLYIY